MGNSIRHAADASRPSWDVASARDSASAAPRGPSTLLAELRMSVGASQRLKRSLSDGTGQFILVSVDGEVSLRVGVTITAEDDRPCVAPAGLTVDWANGTISAGAKPVPLSRTELRILGALMERTGRPVLRSELIARAWPGEGRRTSDRDGALAVYVHSLRKRLASIGAACALRTVRGAGYCLSEPSPMNAAPNM